MRRYLIPLCMIAGSALGAVFGGLADFGLDISIVIGAVMGIIIGSIIQTIINEVTPDEFFKNKSRVDKISNWKKIQIENIDEDKPSAAKDLDDTLVLGTAPDVPPAPAPARKDQIMVPPPRETVRQDTRKKKVVIEEED